MGSSHCGRCGAMSTIWLPTCVFCGHAVSEAPAATAPRSRIRAPVAVEPCTERRTSRGAGTWLEAARTFLARLVRRLAVTRP